MDGTLPEEPGQPALSPCDVEPTSETVRTSDAPVFSRLRSARCGSIASETNLLDHNSHMLQRVTLAHQIQPPGFTHAFPRGPSLNCCKERLEHSHCHRPEARYPVMTNGNGGGPIIQTPSGPRMLHGQDDRQSRTDHHQRPEVLTYYCQLFKSYISVSHIRWRCHLVSGHALKSQPAC